MDDHVYKQLHKRKRPGLGNIFLTNQIRNFIVFIYLIYLLADPALRAGQLGLCMHTSTSHVIPPCSVLANHGAPLVYSTYID
jgi:hypothetical protein